VSALNAKQAADRHRWPQLAPDAPPVPLGMQPRPGVEYGCGRPDCTGCYEPVPVATYGSIDNPVR
jgi:hypothetical protein